MVKKTVKEFKVEYLQILDEEGNADQENLPEFTDEELRKMYEVMVFVRVFDQKVFNMQRQGRVGTFIQVAGQEASQVGAALAMEDDDWLFPSFRESAMLIARKHPIAQVIQYWDGDERGLIHSEGPKNFPISIPVGTHPPHAVGAAWASKLQGKKQASVVAFGDGATSKGDVHEAMNFAGVFQAPVIFLCQNNQYAISVPREKQTHSETIAQKAIAYGFDGIQVDGNDILAVYSVMKDALKKAKEGGGPTLVETLTYRMGDHSTSDDAKKYRDPKDQEEWERKDPIDRFEKFLKTKNLWSEEYKQKLTDHVKQIIEKEVEKFESLDKPQPKDLFETVYAEMTHTQQEQYDELFGGSQGDSDNKEGQQ